MTFLAWSLVLLASGAPSTPVSRPNPLLCQLVIHEVQVARDDLDLDVRTTLSELEASERVYSLLEALWKKDAIERMVFLHGEHDRDTARIDHDLARHLLDREEAILQQYRLICQSVLGGRRDDSSARREAERALARYRKASCEVLATRQRRAATDLAYYKEVLESVRDLRTNAVATEQDVILSERDVETAGKTLAQIQERLQRCRAETGDAREAE